MLTKSDVQKYRSAFLKLKDIYPNFGLPVEINFVIKHSNDLIDKIDTEKHIKELLKNAIAHHIKTSSVKINGIKSDIEVLINPLNLTQPFEVLLRYCSAVRGENIYGYIETIYSVRPMYFEPSHERIPNNITIDRDMSKFRQLVRRNVKLDIGFNHAKNSYFIFPFRPHCDNDIA